MVLSATSGSALARLPAFGFGAAPLGNLYAAMSDDEVSRLLEAAWEAGVRYFDTAPLYGFGLSEARLGAFLQTRPRGEFIVSSKVGRVLKPNAGDHAQRAYFINAAPYEPVFDYSYDGIMRSHEDSLKRLGLDRVDILLMHDIGEATHGPDNKHLFEQAMSSGYKAMDELRSSGAVDAIGLGVNEWQVCAEAMARAQWDCMLLAGRYSLLDQEALDFLDLCIEYKVRVIAAGVFNSGILASGTVDKARFNYDIAPADIVSRVKALAELCTQHGISLGAAAVQFPHGHPAIVSTIAGFASQAQFAEVLNWAAAEIPDVFWADMKSMNLLRAGVPVPQSLLMAKA
jgi:D-threo-aldose 1-dehydrogenase